MSYTTWVKSMAENKNGNTKFLQALLVGVGIITGGGTTGFFAGNIGGSQAIKDQLVEHEKKFIEIEFQRKLDQQKFSTRLSEIEKQLQRIDEGMQKAIKKLEKR